MLNPVLVAVFWGETITPVSLAGAAIVLVSVLTYNILGVRSAAQNQI